MTRLSFALLMSAALAACSKSDNTPATDTTAAASTMAASTSPAAPTVSLAQMEGTWHGRTMTVDKDSTLATWTLVAASDTAHWVATFSNGTKVPMHVVAVAGDSVVSKMGPYKSPSYKNQMVTGQVVSRMRGDTLMGNVDVRLVAKPDSVRRVRIVATRAK